MGERGSGPADSYIGSLISLTSKAEIRYEGFLSSVDAHNSTIVLQNVRSFGREGRKKDVPEIPASDKVYEYIIFRGTDIKDLQVKSSPHAQLPDDPAIVSLKSQYSQPASVSPDCVSSAAGPSVDARLPSLLFQPGGTSLGLWGSPPAALDLNSTGLAVPPSWQGFNRPPGGQLQLSQPVSLQLSPSATSVPLQIQLEKQQPVIPPSLSTVLSTTYFSPLQHARSSEGMAAATPATLSAVTSSPGIVSVEVPAFSVAFSTPSVHVPAFSVAFPPPAVVAPSALSSLVLDPPSSTLGVKAFITPEAKNLQGLYGPLHYQPQVQVQVLDSMQTQAVTVAQSRAQQISKFVSAPGNSPVAHTQALKKGLKVTEISKAMPQPIISKVQPPQQQPPSTQPLLPLPVPAIQHKPLIQGNGSLGNLSYVRRGRGSGNGRAIGVAHPTHRFFEDFDFIAMNEKFNKNEVWGELGKGESKEKGSDGEEESIVGGSCDNEVLDKVSFKSLLGIPKKPVYDKDNFFDSLSCDALDWEEGRSERIKFSQQLKIDTETFGRFPLRSRGGRGGRGWRGRGGAHRGAFHTGSNLSRGRGRGAARVASVL